MMRRVIAAVALAGIAGCQDYNFNPVGKCVIQPGSARITLGGAATADILFVVDDSGSMAAEQQRLADNFSAFITELANAQQQRVAQGLEPFEFHLAITTSSIFEAWIPQTSSVVGAPPITTCGQTTANVCTISQPTNNWTAAYPYQCTTAGAPCVDLITKYWTSSPTPSVMGLGVYLADYPAGDFVAAPSVTAPTNPRVLHFTKDLKWDPTSPDPRIATLIQQFKDNIRVGARGSGMEQHFEAGRLAVQKALAGTQPGNPEWPHPGAKMVVVWVGDEDDCSNPKDPNRCLAFESGKNGTGNDVCTADDTSANPKKFPVKDYVQYFTGLGRQFSAAFIYSANCTKDAAGNVTCTPGKCSCECAPGCATCTEAAEGVTPGTCQVAYQCGGKTNGTRFHDFSQSLRAGGYSTLEASVCAYDFASTLKGIAELVKPVQGLSLPTQPAASQVATLRIESADGKTSRICTGPGAGLDWQFVDCKTGLAVADGVTTSCIRINHSTGHCEANTGETYVAQYLGIVPQPTESTPGGCAQPDTSGAQPPAASPECAGLLEADAFKNNPKDTAARWSCLPTGGGRGTCVCRAPTS